MIKIYGHSDDCFCLEGEFAGENEFSCYDTYAKILIHDVSTGKQVIVRGEYAPPEAGSDGAVWRIGVEQIEEDIPMPEMRITNFKSGYSPLLVIDCSDDTTASNIKKARD